MVEETCPVCGLPKSLCVCEAIEKAEQRIRIFVERRRFGKPTTIIDGISGGKGLVKQLKTKLACGGTFKNGRIELQGDHRNRLKSLLVELGYSEEQIEIS